MQPVKSSLGLVLLLAAWPASAQQKSGENGTMPDPPPPISRQGDVWGPGRSDPFAPGRDKLDCGTQYVVETMAQVPVESCEGFDFKPLYDRAIALADYFSGLKCPGNCGPIRRFQIGREWNCYENSMAFAKILWVFICPKHDHAPPADLEPPSPSSLKEPFRYHRDGPWELIDEGRTTVIDEEVLPLDCPCFRFLRFKYHERIMFGCGANFQEGPYLARAARAAEAWYANQRCPDSCIKSNWSDAFVYKKWNCELDRFEAEYLLKMSCKK